MARFKKEDGARYFGPFAHAYKIRKTLGEMRREFGILLSDSNPKRLEDGRFQLYEDVRSELYGHDNIVTREMYLDRVDKACDFLQGKSKEWLEDLKSKMDESGVANAVFIQTSTFYQWDNRYVMDSTRENSDWATGVVTLSPDHPEHLDVLEDAVLLGTRQHRPHHRLLALPEEHDRARRHMPLEGNVQHVERHRLTGHHPRTVRPPPCRRP